MAVYGYDSQNEELKRIAGGTLYADLSIGFILPSFEDVAPVGFLKLTDTEANRTVSRTTYKELFDWATAKGLIGTGKPFGVGDGSTTFVIPDGREIAFKGIGENSSGASHVKSGGLAVGEFVDDRIQDHKHNQFVTAGGSENYFGNNYSSTVLANGSYGGSMYDGRKGDTTEVKALGCHYYIKAKNVGVPADFIKEVSKLNSYSTDEINTGTTWIDGKPIYRKTFYSATNWANSALVGTIANLDTVVTVKDLTTANGAWHQNFGQSNDGNQQAYTNVNPNGEVRVIRVGVFANSLPSSTTIEYTKTTD